MIMLKKKQHPYFNIPNFGAKNRKHVKARWRKQRGTDNKKRMKLASAGAEPTIGYRNPEELRGIRASGKRVIVVNNVNELKDAISRLDMNNYEITIAKPVSLRKRVEITKLAKDNRIRVTNGAVI